MGTQMILCFPVKEILEGEKKLFSLVSHILIFYNNRGTRIPWLGNLQLP